ncbi:unnamed protein product, partial [Adineta steineri]
KQLKPEEEEFYQFHHITIQCPSKAFDQCTQIIDLSQDLSSNSLSEYSLNN